MKAIVIDRALINVENISSIRIVPHPYRNKSYAMQIVMNNNNYYYQEAPNGSSTNLIDFFKNKIVTIGEDNEV